MNKSNKAQPFVISKKPIRNSAKALIVEAGRLLTTRNRDLFGDFYLLPGGGQQHGETLDQALKRECLEETGAEIEVGNLALIREYLSANHQFAEFDKTIHQVEFMFVCKLNTPVLTHSITEADSMQTGVEWLEISRLHEFRLYPAILIEMLQKTPNLKFDRVYLGDIN
jgi:8-oxo-dGTP pyrophosphatase MutT (NUDIX family)